MHFFIHYIKQSSNPTAIDITLLLLYCTISKNTKVIHMLAYCSSICNGSMWYNKDRSKAYYKIKNKIRICKKHIS